MSLKGRFRIGAIFSVLENTLEAFRGTLKNIFKCRGGKKTSSTGMFFGSVSPES